MFHHMQLGLQVVIEDYVHSTGRKYVLLVGVKLATAVLGVAAALSVLKLALAA
jgi:succinate dehydrogenase / fumarate reductase membrane anchor subunit